MAAKKKYALISVTDKEGVVAFAKALLEHGYVLLSTGGTHKLLSSNEIPVVEVAEFTGFQEILSGRVKTLHPKVHAGILYDRKNVSHLSEMEISGFDSIDLVVVNLYQFESQAQNQHLPLEKAIEFIDIGGPTMLRAAAKNYLHCLPVCDPQDYPLVLSGLRRGEIPMDLRISLAGKVFHTISQYDEMIARYFSQKEKSASPHQGHLSNEIHLELKEVYPLRYGENPHQNSSFYQCMTSGFSESGLHEAKVLQGKELSYNNLLDIDAATSLVLDFNEFCCVAIIKHTNPCGIAISHSEPLLETYHRALSGDPRSAFGGIIATNCIIDAATAQAICSTFYECIATPGFTNEALAIFSAKKNLRLLVVPFLDRNRTKPSLTEQYALRSIRGGVLVQSVDNSICTKDDLTYVTRSKPSEEEVSNLLFAITVAKHVKSNAIIFAKELRTLTIGAGQMSRIDSTTFAAQKAVEDHKSLKGGVMASDAFFPFRDNIDMVARYGIRAIVQPGGSMRDQESIEACNEHGIAMVFTGIRHFRH